MTTSLVLMAAVRYCSFELVDHPPYFPDLTTICDAFIKKIWNQRVTASLIGYEFSIPSLLYALICGPFFSIKWRKLVSMIWFEASSKIRYDLPTPVNWIKGFVQIFKMADGNTSLPVSYLLLMIFINLNETSIAIICLPGSSLLLSFLLTFRFLSLSVIPCDLLE